MRLVEVCGEAPDLAEGLATFAAVTHIHSPEVVGVVPEVGYRVAFGEVACPVNEDGLRMLGVGIVGCAEHQAVFRGEIGQMPLQGHAGRLKAVGVVSWSGSIGLLGARHGLGVDFDREWVGSRRSHEIIGARGNGQIIDDGACGILRVLRSGRHRTRVVVVGHWAAFTVEILSVEGYLAVVAVADAGIQHRIGIEDELKHGVVSFLDVGERKRVVVVHACDRFHIGEGDFVMRSRHLDHIRNLRCVELSNDGPDGSRSTCFLVNGHKLTFNNTGFHAIGADAEVNSFVATNLERHFDVFQDEEAILWGEIEVRHCGGSAFAFQLEVERLHPSPDGTGAHIERAHLFPIDKSYQTVLYRSTRFVDESSLGQEIARNRRDGFKAGVAVVLHTGTWSVDALESDRFVVTSYRLIDTDQQVTTMVSVGSGKVHHQFFARSVEGTFVNDGRTLSALERTHGGVVHFR